MHNRHAARTAALLSALILIATACGSSAPAPTSGVKATATPAPSAPTSTPTAATSAATAATTAAPSLDPSAAASVDQAIYARIETQVE
jgi:hypothetical protein